jgi:hypothetical protein
MDSGDDLPRQGSIAAHRGCFLSNGEVHHALGVGRFGADAALAGYDLDAGWKLVSVDKALDPANCPRALPGTEPSTARPSKALPTLLMR